MKEEVITLEELWNDLVSKGFNILHNKDYEVLDVSDIDILTKGNKYVNMLWLSRHKTTKHMLKILIKSTVKNKNYVYHAHAHFDNYPEIISYRSVIVTTDHVCMTYDRDRILQNVDAKNLNVGDYVSVYDEKTNTEVFGNIESIEDLGTIDEYVYDIEVDDDIHAFYANDILVHNSQFINLQCVSSYFAKKYNLDAKMQKWPKKYKRELWNTMCKFVDDEVNPFVRNLVHNYCHTTQQDVLTYELEYMTDCAIFEGKKHYAVHQCIVEGDDEDHVKYAGIELKKNQVPKEMKEFLAAIYDGVISKDWEEKDYQDYVNALYDKFSNFSIDEISFWKGYNTERQAVGFLQMQTGTTGIAKACTYYNQIINKLNLGKKYDEIRVGDKVRFCYIKENNNYGIECIAYKPGQWPKEFDNIFKVDYRVMFNKIILDPLKRFREACHFEDTDPSKQVQFDIFSL